MRPIDAPKFAYSGGKANLRRFIVRFMPSEGSAYVEPFAGRFNMLFQMKLISTFKHWHLNDIRTRRLYDAILDYRGEPIPDIASGTPISDVLAAYTPTMAALLEPLLCWAGADYSNTKRALPVPARDFKSYSNNILRAQELLRDVTFTEFDAIDVVEQYVNDSEAVLYLDPPYINANVAPYSKKDLDYAALYERLRSARCRWVLSENENDLANRYFGLPQRRIYARYVTGKVKEGVEVLYANHELPEPRVIDFQPKEKSPLSSRKYFNDGEILTRSEVYARWPSSWHKDNFRIEFANLSNDPWVYFDGGDKIEFLPGFTART